MTENGQRQVIKGKTFLGIAIAIVSLMLVPKEAKLLQVLWDTENLYGELSILSGEDIYLISKNAGDTPVGPSLSVVSDHVSKQGRTVTADPTMMKVPPMSISLLKGKRDPGPPSSQLASDGLTRFQPKELLLLTPIDTYYRSILHTFLALILSFFTYMVSIYIAERGIDNEVDRQSVEK